MTAYRIYWYCACEAGEVGPNVTNNRKNSRNNSHEVVYIDHEKTLFPSGHLEAQVSKSTACPVLDGTLKVTKRLTHSYEK